MSRVSFVHQPSFHTIAERQCANPLPGDGSSSYFSRCRLAHQFIDCQRQTQSVAQQKVSLRASGSQLKQRFHEECFVLQVMRPHVLPLSFSIFWGLFVLDVPLLGVMLLYNAMLHRCAVSRRKPLQVCSTITAWAKWLDYPTILSPTFSRWVFRCSFNVFILFWFVERFRFVWKCVLIISRIVCVSQNGSPGALK